MIMATASKRLTRKQIRKPDKFLVFTEQALDFVSEHRPLIIAVTSAIVFLLIGIGAWRLYRSHQVTEGAQHFDQAIALYRDGKYKDAIPAFQKLQSYRWSAYANLAYFYEADSFITLKELNKALTAAQRFIAATEPNSLYRQLGLVTLAYVEELKGQCPQAIQHYTEARQISGPYKDRALLGSAGCYVKTGDSKSALAAYREYLADNPEATNSTDIKLRIAELESKAGKQAAAK
jgi:predicted negative regulator of RcsB-dependent stress response